MIEIKDIQSLFSYIKELHPHCPPEKMPRLTNAVEETWVEALAGYSQDQLYGAARAHARACRFWPSLAEILAQLPPIPEGEKMRYAPLGAIERAHMEKTLEWQEQWHQELKAQGVPTISEALAAGMTLEQWQNALGAAGAWEG